MKAVLLFGKRDARIVDLDKPRIGRDEIRVKLKACGICGTDLEKYEGDFLTPPVLGHEVVGIVEEVGPDVNGIAEGDRVFVHHHVPCRVCYYCLRQQFTLCDQFTKVNLDPCGLAEFFRVPSEIIKKGGVFKLKDSLSDERATFIEPLACCIRAQDKLDISPSDKIAILGAGPAGLLHLMLLKLRGAEVAVFEINEKRSVMASLLGSDLVLDPRKQTSIEELMKWTFGRGVDIALLATGSIEALKLAFKILRKGGSLMLFGSPKKNAEMNISPSFLFINELKILSSYSTTELEISKAISLLERGIVRPELMITHKFKFEDAVKALELTLGGEAVKTIILA